MHIYGIKNIYLWNHERRERRGFSFSSCTQVYIFCVYYRLSGFVCVAYNISDHANLHIDCYLHVTMTFPDMSWRACSLSRGCQEGTEEGGVKLG